MAGRRYHSGSPMRYRRFPPLERDLSLLVLGTVVYRSAPDDVPLDLLDAWYAHGGNVVDTGREYGNAEAVVGRWRRERGLRDEVVVLTKAGHQDAVRRRVTPEDVSEDLYESLRVLGQETIDLFLLHRDDPSKPVGPLVEVLNEHLADGRIRAFGASNWTAARLDEAAAYAAAHGLAAFACSSLGYSLAVQAEPPWPGSVALDDATWYARTQLPVFAWSAQAGGFFAGVSNETVTRVYDDAANRDRRRRAAELGRERGFSANQVALAWVLASPFPTYALVGPRTVPELEDTVGALELELTPPEFRWLASGDDAEAPPVESA